jgi:quercetin dioxygenase-like cupin family protein
MQTKRKEFFSERELLWEDVAPGMRRQIYGFDDKIMMVKVQFQSGAIGQMHEHFHSQVTYVENGEFEVTIGEEKKILGTGDSFYVPPHVLHGCVCRKDGILIDVFSPAREDFLSR